MSLGAPLNPAADGDLGHGDAVNLGTAGQQSEAGRRQAGAASGSSRQADNQRPAALSTEVDAFLREPKICVLCEVVKELGAINRDSQRRKSGRKPAHVQPVLTDDLTRQACTLLDVVEGLPAGQGKPTTELTRLLAARPLLAECGLTVDGMLAHRRRHRQPYLDRPAPSAEEISYLAETLRPRQLEILEMVARMGNITTWSAQGVAGTTPPCGGQGRPYVTGKLNRDAAQKILNTLAHEQALLHTVYLPYRDAPPGTSPQSELNKESAPVAKRPAAPAAPRAVWTLSRAGGKVFMQARDDEHDYELHLPEGKRTGIWDSTAPHDAIIGDLLVGLRQQSTAGPLSVRVQGHEVPLAITVSLKNWWGQAHLEMAMPRPPIITGEPSQFVQDSEAAQPKVVPDALLVVGIAGSGFDFAVPLLVEYSSISRPPGKVVDQAQSREELVRGPALGMRFPMLGQVPVLQQPDGLVPARTPLLCVIETRHRPELDENGEPEYRKGGPTPRNAAWLAAAVAALGTRIFREPGIVQGRVPQYAVDAWALRERGLLAPTLALHAPARGRRPLLRHLIADTVPFQVAADQGHWLRADGVLPIRAAGAKPGVYGSDRT